MPDERTSGHILPPELVEYFLAKLPEAREREIEEHLAGCPFCTEEARHLRSLAMVLNTWSARTHGEAYWQARLADALEAAQRKVTASAWQERLARWRGRWAARAEGAVLVVVESAERASHVVTEGLEAMLRPDARWTFAPVPAPARTRGVGEKAPTANTAMAPGQTPVRVVVDDVSGAAREVLVRVEGLKRGEPSPLVVLLPVEAGREPMVAEPIDEPGSGHRIARFEVPTPGLYVAVFEPRGD